ncbi:MAG: RNA-binding protein [Micrococcales bacterium]|nr:RNA-binding protein [Micrococcales bacterium]
MSETPEVTSVETQEDVVVDEPTAAAGVEETDTVETAAEAGTEGADAPAEAEDDADAEGDADAAPVETPKAGRGRRAALEAEGDVAADFLETLLDIADLDGDIDVDVDGDRAAVSIVDSEEGRVPRRLVGTDGKVLEALQDLTRLAVQSATGERSRLMLDVAGYRAARRAALVDEAKKAIAEVKDSGEAVDLEPMSAFERKVVHDEVLAAGLVSESHGQEPRRYVSVLPAD